MININENRGFSMTFANGWTVSVQIGSGTYCDNSDFASKTLPLEVLHERTSCANAEIAAFKGKKWHDFGDDTVKGWCKPDEILDFMNMIKEK